MAGHDGDDENDRPPGSRSDPDTGPQAGTDGGVTGPGAGPATEAAVPSVPSGEAVRA